MKFSIFACLGFAALMSIAACSSDDEAPGNDAGTITPGNDAGPDKDAASSAEDAGTDAAVPTDSGPVNDAGACGSAVLSGDGVPETSGVGAQPTAAGGAIADGTYVLTKWEIYPPGSIDAFLRKETLVFAGGTVAGISQKETDPATASSGTFTATGTTLTVNVTCPTVTTVTVEYTATATELQFIEHSGGTNEVHTYTKQ